MYMHIEVLTGGDFNTRSFKVFGVAWSFASPLTELLQVLFLIKDATNSFRTIVQLYHMIRRKPLFELMNQFKDRSAKSRTFEYKVMLFNQLVN